MDLLGIGPLELGFVLLIAFLILGPKDLAKTSRSLGRMLRSINQSETWKAMKTLGKEIKMLPTKMMREAAIEDFLNENPDRTIAPPAKSDQAASEETPSTKEDIETGLKAWTTFPSPDEEDKE
ncbi:MAG: twin-arginine translocase TatA/TatE family subunit [Anaerolineales bacterium]